MKKRVMKKWAKRYLADGIILFGYSVDEYPDGYSGFAANIVCSNQKLEGAIRDQAYRLGWDGNHWDSPLKVYCVSEDGEIVLGYAAKCSEKLRKLYG